jgi:hypothetical protein
MTETRQAIVITLAAIARKHGKPYCYPSQETLLHLLKVFHKINTSRRSLNRQLAELHHSCYFDRIRRHRRSNSGKIIFNTTLYKLRKKAFKFMYFLQEESQKFFRVFRVPNLAQYSTHNQQESPIRRPVGSCEPSKAVDEVARSGTFIPDPPPAQLSRVRELLKAIG